MTRTRQNNEEPPSVSVVIPTLNAEKPLRECLCSIAAQDYPGTVEIIVADGGSTDDTAGVASEYGCVLVENPKETGEAGKATGLAKATGDIIALVDSDNLLPGPDWLSRMTAPFADPLIAGTEPIEFTLRKGDHALTRYCALLGMNDPLCYFLGNYDRCSVLSGTWTGMDVKADDRGDYLEVTLEPGTIPTMGANGFLVRKALLEELGIGDYLFDIDVVHGLVESGHDRFAKVKTGIVHTYGTGLATLGRKQLRRVRDFSYYRSLGMRCYPWSRQGKAGLARFIAYCLLVVPLAVQAARGYARKPDSAWALHLPACEVTLAIYCYGFLEGLVRPREQRRAKWSQ